MERCGSGDQKLWRRTAAYSLTRVSVQSTDPNLGHPDLLRCTTAALAPVSAILDRTLRELWIRLFCDRKERVLDSLYNLLIEFL